MRMSSRRLKSDLEGEIRMCLEAQKYQCLPACNVSASTKDVRTDFSIEMQLSSFEKHFLNKHQILWEKR